MARDGILLVDKPAGETSFGVVSRVKAALKRYGVVKIGHAGTLDPFATGLLIVLVGQGTKLSNFLMKGKKIYRATMRLGIETDTLDPDGKVMVRRPVRRLSGRDLEEASRAFIGRIMQTPPAYSAIRHQGVRAYKLARRGEQVQLKARPVEIYGIRIQGYRMPFVELEIVCSAGTYIRSLAADLGRELGTVASLTGLRRTASGSFDVGQALPSEAIGRLEGNTLLEKHVIPPAAAVPEMPAIEVGAALAAGVHHGRQPRWQDLQKWPADVPGGGGYVKMVCCEELVAILELNTQEGVGYEKIKIIRVFS